MKEIWRFSAVLPFLFGTSLDPVINCCRILHVTTLHIPQCTLQISQFLRHLHLIKNTSMSKLCTQHSEGTCELVFSLYGISPFHLAPICFILPPHCSSTNFKMLWTSACSKNGALNWNLLLIFQLFFFSEDHCCCGTLVDAV